MRGLLLGILVMTLGAACWTRDEGGGTTPSGPGPTATGTTPGGPPGDVLTEARQYNLTRINALRGQAGSQALTLDDRLDAFAQAASTELSQDHQAHQYFTSNYASCGCGVNAENQGDWNGWAAGPVHQQIDQILEFMMSEGPGGGHHDNILNPQWRRLGVGIVNPGGQMYFTNDFGP